MMLIYAYTIILTIICESKAFYEREYTPNVGTVLFSNIDISKKQWTKADIGLLRARKYFQSLLPPPVFINTFNEDYVNILLGYFRDAYSAIKREAADAETDTIMTTALSDAIGGYLKVWVLPVAKLDYYGGTVSQDNVIKLFQFYNEIKRYLDTDGSGWRKPDEKVLNSMTINVAPLKLASNTRSMSDPCEHLAYFEKTPTGLSIPIPNVHWNERLSTMFIPLKNVSLVPMNTPDSAQNLMKYYESARSCIQSTNPKEQDKFDEKFQTWLTRDVVPHLKDENLYLALGSVLSLVNRTRDLCNNVIDLYGNKFNTINTTRCPVDLTSKKMWIITVILLIEIAWCIPALIYILCSKKVHKKDCSSNVYLFIDNNKPEKKDKTSLFQGKPSCTGEDPCTICKDTYPESHCPMKTGIKLFRRSHQTHMEFEAQYPSSLVTNTVGTGTRSYFSSKDQSASAIKTAVDCGAPRKSSLKKSSSNNFSSDRTNSTHILSRDATCYNSYATIQAGPAVASVMEIDKYQRFKKDKSTKREKFEERKKAEERKQIEETRRLEERKKAEECKLIEEFNKSEDCRRIEEIKKAEEIRKTDELRKNEERKKADEIKKNEERKKADESRKNEERKKADESRKVEERKKADEFRKNEERKKADEFRKNEERKKADEFRKNEERKKAEEFRKNEERKKADESRKNEERKKADEFRKNEERKKADEFRKNEERKKADESRKIEERKKADECKKNEERKKADECKKNEERKKTEECRKNEERKKIEECRRLEERKKAYECRNEERKKVDDGKRVVELKKDRVKSEECRRLEERKFGQFKTAEATRQFEECCKKLEDITKLIDATREGRLKKIEKCEIVDEAEANDDSDSEEENDDSQDTSSPPPPCCPCTGCFQSPTHSLQESDCASDDNVALGKQVETKTTRFQVTQEYMTKRKFCKNSGAKPYLEITIDRPATEICVGVSGCQSRECRVTKLARLVKPSKIPKPAGFCNIVQPLTVPTGMPTPPAEKHKSMIPQLKKKTVDDIVLTRCKCGKSRESKLNDTF